MANSIIDDMLKEQIPNNNNPKKKKGNSKKGIIILIIFLILIIIFAVCAIFYLKSQKKNSSKSEFLKYIASGNFETILSFDKYTELLNKLQTESSNTESKITLSANGEEGQEIDNIELVINSKNDIKNSKSYAEAILNYASNEIFEIKALASPEGVAIKSDEIVQKYVGSSYKNLGDVLSRAFKEELNNSDLGSLDVSNIQNSINLPTFSITSFPKYIEVLNKNVDDGCFSSKEVTLQRENENIDVTEYTMALSGKQVTSVADGLLAELENDDTLLQAILSIYADSGVDLEKIKLEIENLRNSLQTANIKDTDVYSIKVYVADNKTLKVSIDLNKKQTIDIEYTYSDTKNSVLVTYLKTEKNSGYTIKLAKTNSDVSEKLEVSIGLLEDSQTSNEIYLTSDLMPTQNSYNIDNKIKITVPSIVGELNASTNITFEETEVEDLNSDNCLFMDTLDEANFDATVKAIKDRTEEVIQDKISQISLIVSNNPKTEVQQPEVSEGNNEEAKEAAKQKIIDAVSSAMTEAQNNGQTYELKDVENVVIDSDDYDISVSDDIAIIIVDGFEFKLDADFNLSE